ncbi:FAS-associated factor 2-like [Toxorhynchites rutilus septentrionalis]|uniref:FAS-associated factor 2-like n=1 Tax=Toxorhynchites rutilus septentrionalis TaxID=329112 RepID=UPI0024783AB2|nr:FAS-associated factor 2-like [Toxorhynchites rutilus septentrionalis]
MDSDGLSNEQTEKVLQFQDITGLEDINVCRDILIRHQWDLEVAFQEHLNIREGRPSAYASESRAPQVVNDRFLQHVFAAQRGPGAPVPSGVGGMIGFVVNYVFNFCYNTLSSIVAAFLNLFKDKERIVTDPLGDVLKFIQTYNGKYPEHPVFYHGTYAQALNDAKRELKFLLVYLHSESSTEANTFCRDTLSNAQVIEYVNRRMLFWACDISSPEGYRVSHSINARTYPVLVIIALRANKMVIMGRMEGHCNGEELIRRMETVVNDNEVWLNQARQDRLERDLTQTLRRQQDDAYQMSLRADQEKQRRKQKELEKALAAQQAIEADKLAEMQRLQNIEMLKMELASQVPSEPEPGAPGTISIVFKLPSGLRLERRFLASHTLQDVHNFIFCHPEAPDSFEITTNFPKRVLQCAPTEDPLPTLVEAGLKNREVLFVADLDA